MSNDPKVQIPKQRVIGLDFARALAILGMLIVNFKTVMNAGERGPEWLVAFATLFEGRASTVFVILAGIGVSFMTAKARHSKDPQLLQANRSMIRKRALFLFVTGMLLYAVDWSGDILHYYGVYMLIAASLLAVSNRVIVTVWIAFLAIGTVLQLGLDYGKGWNPLLPFIEYMDFWTPEGFIRNLLFNGYHPLFPWMCFFLLGLWLGRLDWTDEAKKRAMLRFSLAGAILLETLSWVLIKWTPAPLDLEAANYLFTTKPYPPNLLFVLSGSCTATAVILLCILFTDKFAHNWITLAMIRTGQLALTTYVGHVFIGIGGLIVIGWLENRTLAEALLYSVSYFAVCAVFSYFWRSKFKRGPLEALMRKLSG